MQQARKNPQAVDAAAGGRNRGSISGSSLAPGGEDAARLSDEHRQHLLDELGSPEAVETAIRCGARSVSAQVAAAMGFRMKARRGQPANGTGIVHIGRRYQASSGLYLPFTGGWGQLRCDDPPLAADGRPCKYLNRAGRKQTVAVFGEGDPVVATEGWKDALRIHIATGMTVAAMAGVWSHRLLPPSVRWIVYDADAATNPGVWGPLVKAGLERSGLRLAFFPSSTAGPKGGACEFFRNGGTPEEFEQLLRDARSPRKLLLEISQEWSPALRADFKTDNLRQLAELALKAGIDAPAVSTLAGDAARAMRMRMDDARQIVRHAEQSLSETEGPEERMTQADLLGFLRPRHRFEQDELRDLPVVDGVAAPSKDQSTYSVYLADRYGLEVHASVAAHVLRYLCASNPFNPIRRYFEQLASRTDLPLLSREEIGHSFGIAGDDEASLEALRRQLIAAVKRGCEPSYKADCMLILASPSQGDFKSEAIASLAPDPEWFDSETELGDFTAWPFLIRLGSSWLFLLDECDKELRGKHASAVKGMLTRGNDKWARKGENDATLHPRRCVFFGTTNQEEFLNDHTGNRRFWISRVAHKCDAMWVRRNRDSIWLTALSWACSGHPSYFPDGDPLRRELMDRAWAATFASPYAERLHDVLDGLPAGDPDFKGISQSALVQQALGIDLDGMAAADNRRLMDLQEGVRRAVTAQNFTTHDGRYRWEKGRGRFDGSRRNPRAGYVPVPAGGGGAAAAAAPSGPTEWMEPDLPVPVHLRAAAAADTSRDGPTPDTAGTSQGVPGCADPVPTPRHSQTPDGERILGGPCRCAGVKEKLAEEENASNAAPPLNDATRYPYGRYSKNPGTPGTDPETPSAAGPEAVPTPPPHPGTGAGTGAEPDPDGRTAAASAPLASSSPRLVPGDLVELRQPDGTWEPGWVVERVHVLEGMGRRLRIEKGDASRMAGPGDVRPDESGWRRPAAGPDLPAPSTCPPGPEPASTMTNTAEPVWLPELRRQAREKPKAAAPTLAIYLELAGHPGLTGAQVKPWLDLIKAEQQDGAAGLSQEGMDTAAA